MFIGTEQVKIEVKEATKSIVLHALDVNISMGTVTRDGKQLATVHTQFLCLVIFFVWICWLIVHSIEIVVIIINYVQ
jgi:hypothetical protein